MTDEAETAGIEPDDKLENPSPALVQAAHWRALESSLILMGLGSLAFNADGDADQALRGIVHEWLVVHAIHARRAIDLLSMRDFACGVRPRDHAPHFGGKDANGDQSYYAFVQTIIHTPKMKVLIAPMDHGQSYCFAVKIRTEDHNKTLKVSPYSLGAAFANDISATARKKLSELVMKV